MSLASSEFLQLGEKLTAKAYNYHHEKSHIPVHTFFSFWSSSDLGKKSLIPIRRVLPQHFVPISQRPEVCIKGCYLQSAPTPPCCPPVKKVGHRLCILNAPKKLVSHYGHCRLRNLFCYRCGSRLCFRSCHTFP